MDTDAKLVMETVLGMLLLVDQGVYTEEQAHKLMSHKERVAYYLIRKEDMNIESESPLVTSDDEIFFRGVAEVYGSDSRSIMATLAARYRKYALVQKIRDFVEPSLPFSGDTLIELGMVPGPEVGEVLQKLRVIVLNDAVSDVDVSTQEYRNWLLEFTKEWFL